MEAVKINKSVVIDLIRELFDKPSEKDIEPSKPRGMKSQPIKANATVDPMAAVSDPDNKKFVPQDKAQFQVAIGNMTSDLPDEKYGDLYKKIGQALKDIRKETETSSISTKTIRKDKENKKMANSRRDTQAEAYVRMQVRKILNEVDKKTSLEKYLDSDEFTSIKSVPRKYAFASDKELELMGVKPGATRDEISAATGLSGQSVIDSENTSIVGDASIRSLIANDPVKWNKIGKQALEKAVNNYITDTWLKQYLIKYLKATNDFEFAMNELKDIVAASKNLSNELSMDEMLQGTLMDEIVSQYMHDGTPGKGAKKGSDVISDWISQISNVIHQTGKIYKPIHDKEAFSDKTSFKQARGKSRAEIGHHLAALGNLSNPWD